MRWHVSILWFLLRLASRLPLRVLHALGTGLGYLLARLPVKLHRHTVINLRLVFPQRTAEDQRRTCRRILIETGKSITEIATVWGGGPQRALRLVREVEGEALFEAARQSGNGLIIAAPHMGCWELLNFWLCLRTPLAIVYRPPRQPALEPLLVAARGALEPEQVRAEGVGIRTLYRRLQAGGTVGILPDQLPKQGEGEFAPFFGVPALTMVLVSRLAQRTGATVLFAFAERLPHGTGFRIRFLPAPDGIADPDIPTAVAALNRGIEICARRAFDQYQWHYKRFQYQPDGTNPYLRR